MKKQKIAFFGGTVGTIQSGINMLEKLIDTDEEDLDETEGNNSQEPEDPRKKDPDNHHVEQLTHKTDEEIVEDKIKFCKAVLDDDETNAVVSFCCNNDTHELYGKVNIQMNFLKELARLYLDAHEQ